ncbi:cation:proton antiporter [Microdochium nivale]|nr:cation:proton antiporter [Microdochium nivale]
MAATDEIGGAASLPYHEPSISQILVMISFLLVLNGVGSVIDRVLYCGLIGQVLVGIAWGTPGAQWLASTLASSTAAFEHVVVQLGYLGLILLVYEGGVSTSIAALKANMLLAIAVAATGVAAPMGLSFALGPLVRATPLQCFAAGAALCSTSLGTTFSVLSTSGLSATKLGSVLSTAAMMDDVLGLVMVQIVSSLGSSAGGSTNSSSVSINPATILRPVLVSIAFAVMIPLANRYLLRPAMRYLDDKEEEAFKQQQQEPRQEGGSRGRTRVVFGILATKEGALVIQTALLLGLVAAAAYAGASVLLAAYLAGVMVCWWDAERESRRQTSLLSSSSQPQPSNSAATPDENERTLDGVSLAANTERPPRKKSEHTGIAIYEHYYGPAVNRILKPFFFASIGFSIPITKMFSGPIVWRGLVYTILMILAKVLCGLWLVRIPRRNNRAGRRSGRLSSILDAVKSFFTTRLRKATAAVMVVAAAANPRAAGKMSKSSQAVAPTAPFESGTTAADTKTSLFCSSPPSSTPDCRAAGSAATQGGADGNEMVTMSSLLASSADGPAAVAISSPSSPPIVPSSPASRAEKEHKKQQSPAKPVSLYPAAIISSAMTARGEIGFLISAVAESKGIFSSPQARAVAGPPPSSSAGGEPSEMFLVATWAIVLCTIVGPLVLGILVRRVKRLEAQRRGGGSGEGSAADGRPAAADRHQDYVLGAWGI